MSDQDTFVQRIKKKLLRQQQEGVGEGSAALNPDTQLNPAKKIMDVILKLAKEQAEKGDDPGAVARAELAALILPNVCLVGGTTINHEEAKKWAFACGEMVGLLAGLSLQEGAINGAIAEVAIKAQSRAKDIRKNILDTGMVETPTPGAPVIGGTSPADTANQQRHMIADLRRQAETETDLATKAALKAMADSMEKELREASSKKEAA